MPVVVLLLTLILAAQTPAPAEPRDLRTVYVCLLTRGTAWTSDTTTDVQQLQQAHASYLARLSATGNVLATGPVGGDGNLRGLLLLKAESADAARRAIADDPSVNAGRLAADVVPMTVAGNWFTQTPGRDDAAVRQFVVGLVRHPAAAPAGAIDDARVAYLWRLRQAGTLVFAGDATDGSGRGLLIFASDNLAAIRTLATDDPAVRADQITIDWQTWYAPEGVFKMGTGRLTPVVPAS